MRIIPVIDLLGGQVVRAVAGNRAAYRPIQSRLASSADPVAIAVALLDLAPFPTLYIADLDAIVDNGSDRNRPAMMNLCTELLWRGDTELWLDAANAPWGADLVAAAAEIGVRISLVTGSESLANHETADSESVLSLDYRAGQFLGPTDLEHDASAWPNRLIVMDLAAVGVAGGPAFARIDALMTRAQLAGRSDIAFYAAGGVRDEADLEALAQRNVRGVLIASALHDGSLDAAALAGFIA